MKTTKKYYNLIKQTGLITIILLSILFAYLYGKNTSARISTQTHIPSPTKQPDKTTDLVPSITPNPTIAPSPIDTKYEKEKQDLQDQIFKDIEDNYNRAKKEYSERLDQENKPLASGQSYLGNAFSNSIYGSVESYRKAYEIAANSYLQAILIRAGRPDLAEKSKQEFASRYYDEEIMSILIKIDSTLNEELKILQNSN